jgi:hypothetical protein
MDTLRVGTRDPVLLLTRTADKLVSLKPGEVIRAQVAEVLPGGEVNLRIQGNLFRARSQLPLPENTSVLFRVLGQKREEGASEIRLQFLEIIAHSESGQMSQRSASDPLQTLTQELASNLAGKTQVPAELASTVECLLKALPDDPSRIPAETREQLLTLLQTNLRTTGQSIQDRLNSLLRQVMDQDSPPMRNLANVREQVFADIETISQIPLKSSLANTGVGLEARLRVLAEALAEAGDSSLRNPLSALGAEQSAGTTPLPPELKDILQQLDQKGIFLPPELKEALQQLDQKGISLPAELKDALMELNLKGIPLRPEFKDALMQLAHKGAPLPSDQQTAPLQPDRQADPLQSDFKARLLQVRAMLLEQQEQLLKLDLFARAANARPAAEKKAILEQMLQSVDGLLQDVETFQLLSKLTDSFYTFLPFIWKGLSEAEIAFKRSGSGPHGRSYYCLVHLDLEELGKLDIVAMMAGSEFLVSFKTDHDAFRSALNTHMNELQEMFAAKGLKLGLVSCYRMQEKQLEPFERLESFRSIINIRI